MDLYSKVYVAGHKGMVGSAIVRALREQGFSNLILRSSSELDLTDQVAVNAFFAAERPEYIFLAAAKVGGIGANNTYRGDFIYENLMIQSNVIHAASIFQAKKLLFLGSSCIYPREAPQPLKETYLLSGELEYTNEPYAIAKIAGIKMCQGYNDQYSTNFISVMPTNLYGPNDNFDLNNSHVLPALMRKFFEGKNKGYTSVTVWGTGDPLREFLHVDDLAQACIFLMKVYNENDIINIGSGVEISIRDLALLIKEIVGYKGNLKFDQTKPNGTHRKLLDVSKINSLGWRHSIDLHTGIQQLFREVSAKDWLD